jgi:hypothetical protein
VEPRKSGDRGVSSKQRPSSLQLSPNPLSQHKSWNRSPLTPRTKPTHSLVSLIICTSSLPPCLYTICTRIPLLHFFAFLTVYVSGEPHLPRLVIYRLSFLILSLGADFF